MKKLNYKIGVIKRLTNNGKKDFQPGELIAKVNESKNIIKDNKKQSSETQLGIMGLI